MPYRNTLLYYLFENFREIFDAAAGSITYLFYAVWIKKQEWSKALASFLIGALFAIYVAPQVCALYPNLNKSFCSYFFGLIGVRVTETILTYDLKVLLSHLLKPK